MAVSIVTRPEIACAGIKVQTNFDAASRDCPALWEKFSACMQAFPINPAFKDESFGAAIMTGETTFEYWAVMALASDAVVPDGMETITLPAGDYVESEQITLEELGGTYDFLFTEWPKTQEKYTPDVQGVCYEKYTSDFMKTGKLIIYCPLAQKNPA